MARAMRLAVMVIVPVLGILPLFAESNRQGTALAAGVSETEFVFESAPFASAHASTIVETRDGLAAAWFGGTREGASDVGIWVSRRVGGTWTAPTEVATGVHPDGTRFPTWHPVLFELRKGALALLYK